MRQAILKRAFEGKLVPQDPTDEPASVLLERIRAEPEQASASATTRLGRRKKLGGAVPAEQLSLIGADGPAAATTRVDRDKETAGAP